MMVHHLHMLNKRKTCPCTQSVVLQCQCNQHAANNHIYHTVPSLAGPDRFFLTRAKGALKMGLEN